MSQNQISEIHNKPLKDLYKDLAPIARAYLRKQGCTHADAEDFLQEAFLRLWSKERCIPNGMELAYLIRMLKNLMIDEFRRMKAKRQFLRCLDESAYDVPASDERPELEAKCLLWEQLSEAARDPKASAFILQVKQGLSLEQIADQQKVPVGTVAAQISRYRGRFKDSFQKAWDCTVWC